MAKKRKAAKKPAKVKTKKPVKKVAKKAAKKATKKTAKKPARMPRGPVRVASAIEGVYVPADAALQGRLRALANGMKKPLDEVLTQALSEFAENWEDHMQTIEALKSDDDRMQIAVKPEGPLS